MRASNMAAQLTTPIVIPLYVWILCWNSRIGCHFSYRQQYIYETRQDNVFTGILDTATDIFYLTLINSKIIIEMQPETVQTHDSI